MDVLLLSARIVVAAILVVAGLAKLADLPGARRAVVGFGVPDRIARPVSVLLPVIELAVAVGLLPATSSPAAAAAAFALFAAFTVTVGANLLLGRRPDCHCFGQLHSSPAGPSTLVRNAACAALAALVALSAPGPSAVGWIGTLTAIQLLSATAALGLAAFLAAGAWLLLRVLRQNGQLLLRLDALDALVSETVPVLVNGASNRAAVRVPAPEFELATLDGDARTLAALRAPGRPVILLFTHPNCGPCSQLLPEVGRWQRDDGHRISLALISQGSHEANAANASEHGLRDVLLQHADEVARAYGVRATPTAVLIDAHGGIDGPPAVGPDAVRRLTTTTIGASAPSHFRIVDVPANGHPAAARATHTAPLAVGDPAPEFTLRDPTRANVSLVDFRGAEALIMSWNPGCGFCQRMLPDLRAWDTSAAEGAVRLVVLSSGSVEENRAMRLKSTVLQDDGLATARKFGVHGTPMALLLDQDGRVASDVAAGAPSVLALARRGTLTAAQPGHVP